MCVNGDNATYFDSFGVENNLKEIKKIISINNIKINIYRIQVNDLIMCGYCCIGFIDFALKEKSLLDCTNILSPKEYDIVNN